jgi:hypothetical protein
MEIEHLGVTMAKAFVVTGPQIVKLCAFSLV